ncbi:MAG: Lhr-like helicase, partial [Isosphaeraceae bacterium]
GELAAAVVAARAVREGRIEEISTIDCPLDVLAQQILAIACLDDAEAGTIYDLVRHAWPFRNLTRDDFDACLNYLAGDLAAPAGAYQKDEGAPPRWTSPRLWKSGGHFGVRHRRVVRWFRMNCGTIYSEESLSVESGGRRIGQLEQPYADRLQTGDRFCLDGRTLEFKRIDKGIIVARDVGGDAMMPQWTSERPGLSAVLARELVAFREKLGRLVVDNPASAELWLAEEYQMRPADALCLVRLWQRQIASSEIPTAHGVLVEIYPENDSLSYAFHCPLHRPASEALGRAMAARFAARRRHDMRLAVTDLGFVIQGGPEGLSADDIRQMFHQENLRQDVVEGLDRGELVARRFRAAAATGLMVLKNAEGRKPRVGGQDWVSQKLFPVVREACPDHPLLREAQREALEQILDLPALATWLGQGPAVRIRKIRGISPFTTAWLEPFGREGSEAIQVETPDEALSRLHQRLFGREGNFVA